MYIFCYILPDFPNADISTPTLATAVLQKDEQLLISLLDIDVDDINATYNVWSFDI